jgi:beta-glucosidase
MRQIGNKQRKSQRSQALACGILSVLVPCGAMLLTDGPVAAAPRPAAQAQPSATEIDASVEKLLAQMTLDEKIGQMSQLSEGGVATGPHGTVGLEDSVRAGSVGSILNAVGTERTRALQHLAVDKTRLGIPLIFGLDVIHGYKTIFPIPLAESCSWDLASIEKSARVSATEAAADGVHWTFAPMVDIARDPRWGRIAEGAGEDTYLGQQIARARVHGFQGDNLQGNDSVIACVKHFAAYGAVQSGRDYNTVDLSRRTLLETYLPPYHAAIEAGARTVMSAFNEYDGTPCSANQFLLDDVLKQQWGFKGFVVTDWEAITEMIDHGTVANRKEAARAAAIAGMHMDMQSSAFQQNLGVLVQEGKVSQAVVDDAVRRILRVKFEKGLFADPYRACDNARRDRTVMSKENLQAAREGARRAMVLLKNARQVLPLAAKTRTIALIGPLANDRVSMLGTWAGQSDGKLCKSVLDGLAERHVKVLSAKGCEISGGDTKGFAAAVKAARQADVVVAVLGENPNMSGEAECRADIGLPGQQRALLKALKATGKPIVLVLMNGRPLTLEWEQKNLDTILEAWHLGTQAGLAVCDVLFGDYNPSGKLVTTFPRAVGQIPLFYNHMNTGRPFDPKNHFTTQYLDLPNDPVYPFGFGLSYTHFDYSPLTLSKPALGPNDTLRVGVTVKNSGQRDGEEVAQLYVRQLVGSVTRPVKELKGFRKVLIKRGASATLQFKLGAKDLAFYRKDMSFGTEAGQFKVWVGPNSETGSEGNFSLTQSVTVSP